MPPKHMIICANVHCHSRNRHVLKYQLIPYSLGEFFTLVRFTSTVHYSKYKKCLEQLRLQHEHPIDPISRLKSSATPMLVFFNYFRLKSWHLAQHSSNQYSRQPRVCCVHFNNTFSPLVLCFINLICYTVHPLSVVAKQPSKILHAAWLQLNYHLKSPYSPWYFPSKNQSNGDILLWASLKTLPISR